MESGSVQRLTKGEQKFEKMRSGVGGSAGAYKLGTIKGVFIPTFQNISELGREVASVPPRPRLPAHSGH